MLRLSVDKKEYLMIGEDIKITILGCLNGQVKVMIDAPKDVNIARGKAIAKHMDMPENVERQKRQKI